MLPEDDLVDAELGDKRRTSRAMKIAATLGSRPERSLPEAFGNGSALDVAYRFFSNEAVAWTSIQAAHAVATWERAKTHQRVLAVHDTTDIVFPRRNGRLRDGLAGLTSRTQGFYLHTSILVAGQSQDEETLGAVGLRPYVHQSDVERDGSTAAFWRQQNGLLKNEADRWFDAIETVQKAAPEGVEVVHVGDRETDDYSLYARLVRENYCFVLRNYRKRSVHAGDEKLKMKLTDALERTRWLPVTRDVPISARSSDRCAKELKTHPARGRRIAALSFRACKVDLLRPATLCVDPSMPPHLEVNVVDVLERNPPANQDPVHWVLITNRPIVTAHDVLSVVDDYCGRWNIEEFFKCLKSGCLAEQAQLDTAPALLCLLAMLMPVVTYLLRVRYMQRESPQAAATEVLSEDELTVLQAQHPECFVAPESTVNEAVNAMARLGGHLSRNGKPGWLTLARGANALFFLAQGWKLAQRPSQKNGSYH
jgi:hypothetical protein